MNIRKGILVIMRCKLCHVPLARIPRTPLQKLLLTGRRYMCGRCGMKYFSFLGFMFKLKKQNF